METDRLDSWKEIAAYLGRTERTVRRWEEREGLPVHRLVHDKRGTIYAFRSELDAWRDARKPAAASSSSSKPIWHVAVALAMAAAIAMGGWAWYRSYRQSRLAVKSIAVLPFDNLSHDPSEDWFSDGMTETLITELSKVRALNVISRTSVKQYRSTAKSTKAIAGELGVDAVVEGSALRVGDRVRITAQLIATASDTHLWGADFDADLKDVLALQRNVAREITREVGARLAPEDQRRLDQRAHQANPQAVATYLNGLYQFNRSAVRPAADLAREAIKQDPDFAAPYLLLGMSLEIQADFHMTTHVAILPEAQTALRRALELEPDNAEAMSWLGTTCLFGQHDWTRAEPLLRRGFELAPSSSNTAMNLAFLLAAQGKYREATDVADRALQSDPANPMMLESAGHINQLARRYDESARWYRKALALAPTSDYARLFLHVPLLLGGHPDEAFDAWLAGSGDVRGPLGLGDQFRDAYRTGGWPAVWNLYLERVPARARWPNYKRWAVLFLHRDTEALDMLEELERTGDAWMTLLEDPVYDHLRHEPRFQAMLKRVGYPPSVWN
jgi:TolB-like protein/Flp pilus assembly protein TadD